MIRKSFVWLTTSVAVTKFNRLTVIQLTCCLTTLKNALPLIGSA